jgi:hypothetical protein
VAIVVAFAFVAGCASDNAAAPPASTTTSVVDPRASARQAAVFKVAADIPKGMSGKAAVDDGYLKAAMIPEEFLPLTATTDIEQIKDKFAVADFAEGQILVDGMFVPMSELCGPKASSCPNS